MDFELYKKMLRGECSPEETSQVMRWLQEDPDTFEPAMMQEISELEQEKMPPAVRQQMLDWFASKGIAAPEEAPVVPIGRKWYRWASAAAVLLFVAAGWLTYSSLKSRQPSQAWLQIQNTGATVKLVILPDSSRIWLRALATLRYREDFNRHAERQVQLTGEAYFKVAQQESHPFIVQTGQLNTKVLGTEFNVEAYAYEPFIKVTLQKGKVQVTSIQSQRILQPGQMALYAKSGDQLQVRNSTVNNPDAWTGEGLVLNDVPLPDALRRIARKYGQMVEFDSLKAMKHQHITASYEQMDIEQVLAQLGFACSFSARKTAKGYHIIWK